MKQKVAFMLLVISFWCASAIQAQTGSQITGKVVDASGELAGVSVVVKGTTNGVTTNMDGRIQIGKRKSGDDSEILFCRL